MLFSSEVSDQYMLDSETLISSRHVAFGRKARKFSRYIKCRIVPAALRLRMTIIGQAMGNMPSRMIRVRMDSDSEESEWSRTHS